MSTQEFTAQPRRVPGQGVLERLEQRKQRRPRIGMSPEFYARFGLADPWAQGPLELQDDPGSLFTYVDATRYRRMMRRLAFSRWRRERRAKLFQSRRVGLPTALRRAFPGETRRFAFGLRTLGMSEMVVPEAPEPEVIEVPVQKRPRWVRDGMRPVDNPWTSTRGGPARSVQTRERQDERTRSVTTARPARVIRQRAMDRVGARLEQSQAGRDPVRKALEAAGPRMDRRTQAKVQSTLAATAHLPPAERAVRVREVLRTVRVIREVFEERVARTVPSKLARPAEIARGRVAAEPSRRRGLRPVMGRSPSMDVLAPAPEPQAQESAPAPRKSNTQRALARASGRKVSAWSKPPSGSGARVSRSISRSPVARSGAPLRRTASGAYVPARRLRTADTSTVASSAFRTEGSETQGARSATTQKGQTSSSQTHRTASGTTERSDTLKTRSGEVQRSQATRTPNSETQGARTTSGASHAGEETRSMTTGARQDTAARSGTTQSTTPERSEALSTQVQATQGARSFTTAATRSPVDGDAGELGESALPQSTARSFRTAASAHAAARAGRAPAPDRSTLSSTARVAARSASGAFVPARRVAGAASSEAPPSESHGAWALQRLERTGTASTARRGRSLLPRMAPRAPESTYVVHADPDVDVQAMVAEIKKSVPNAQVSVRDPKAVSAWGPSPVAAAAERAHRSPIVSQTSATSASKGTERGLERAVQRSRVRHSRNPVRYARSASAEQVVLAAPDVAGLSSLPAKVRQALGSGLPTQAVKTAQGVWIPATSFTTESAGSWSGARALRTAASRSVGAQSGRTPAGSITGAARRRTPGTQGVGAGRFRTPPLSGGGSQVFLSPEREDAPAQGFQTGAREDRGARIGSGRPVAWAGARTQLTERGDWQGAGSYTTARAGFAPGERVSGAGRSARGAQRNTLSTLESLAAREHQHGAPSWAERSTRPTRIRTPGDLVDQLVQAQDVEELVGLIVERGSELRPNMGLPKPVIQVIEQIRSVAAAQEETGGRPQGRTPRVGARASTRRRNAKIIRGFSSLKGGTASSTAGVGPDKVMKLASKLRNLIHLAEGGRTADAQRQVKLAHGDRPDGRMENGTDSGNSETAAKQSVDIEALAREVLDVVNREKELRQERRQEESDADVWW